MCSFKVITLIMDSAFSTSCLCSWLRSCLYCILSLYIRHHPAGSLLLAQHTGHMGVHSKRFDNTGFKGIKGMSVHQVHCEFQQLCVKIQRTVFKTEMSAALFISKVNHSAGTGRIITVLIYGN